MNFHGPITERSLAADFAPPSGFLRPPRTARQSNPQMAGIMGVVLVHAILALLYFTMHTTFAVYREQHVAVIDLPPELPEEVKPPPPPKFTLPEVYVPPPIIPLITLEEPQPTPDAITIPLPAATNVAPNAPLAQAATVPFEGYARAAYVGALMKHLNRFKQYPQSAKLRREQGVVSMRFTIDRNGHVLSSSVTRSSGSKALDAEVLEALKRADPLPRIPDVFGREQLDLVVPVEFVLR
jgi:periplasmic protein TonB